MVYKFLQKYKFVTILFLLLFSVSIVLIYRHYNRSFAKPFRYIPRKEKIPLLSIYDSIKKNQTFSLWAAGCPHSMIDLKNGRLGIAESILQSEKGDSLGAPPFHWDAMVILGDYGTHINWVDDFEGRLIEEQLHVGRLHHREQIYSLMGNHDAGGEGKGTSTNWFHTWIDPLGEHSTFSGVDSSKRPFKTSGTFMHYSFEVGNILFLMLSDRNDLHFPIGKRKDSNLGFPAGAITLETFNWWKEQIELNPDKIIVTCAHHMLKNTTIASGEYEGLKYKYHFPNSPHDKKGSSYLYFIGKDTNSNAVEDYLEAHPGAVDLWLGAHTHINPADTIDTKTYCEKKHGTFFINCAILGARGSIPPTSRILDFKLHTNEVTLQCYYHNDIFYKRGIAPSLTKSLLLDKKFNLE